MSCAVVPVKLLEAAKSRLLPHLTQPQRELLSLAMLRDVLTTLRHVPFLERVVVLTPDETVAETARDVGAEVLLRDDSGLNPAINAAARDLGLGGHEPFLVVLGDVPGIEEEDVETLFDSVAGEGGPSVALAASSDGGSAALLRTPHTAIAARFGADSARAHREAAHEAGIAYRELELPSLSLDLDRVADLDRFLQSRLRASHTRQLLESLPLGETT